MDELRRSGLLFAGQHRRGSTVERIADDQSDVVRTRGGFRILGDLVDSAHVALVLRTRQCAVQRHHRLLMVTVSCLATGLPIADRQVVSVFVRNVDLRVALRRVQREQLARRTRRAAAEVRIGRDHRVHQLYGWPDGRTR